jgi:hypothetical protein
MMKIEQTSLPSSPQIQMPVMLYQGQEAYEKFVGGSAGRGKRGGVRVIYFNRLANGEIWLLLVYGKSMRENIPAHVLRQIKEEIKNA